MKKYFKRIRLAWYWRKVLAAYQERNHDEAILALNAMRRIAKLPPLVSAFSGLVYFDTGKEDIAKRFFEKARKSVQDNVNEDSGYISVYCDYYLKLINGKGTVASEIDAAAQIECRPALKRWLRLPSPEEYRRWMLEHPE